MLDSSTLARIQASSTASSLSATLHSSTRRRAARRAGSAARDVCAAAAASHIASAATLSCAAVPVNCGCAFAGRASDVSGWRRSSRSARCLRAPAAKPNDKRKLSPIESNEHRRFLAKYVNEVDPSVVDTFSKSAPASVTEAMRSAVTGVIGSLPMQYFEVTISTVGDNLKSLMFSFLMTGYLFRNVEHHLELKHGLERALPSSALFDDGEAPSRVGARFGVRSEEPDGYAPGANLSGIEGVVTRWRHATGKEQLPAAEYIEMLEKEVQELRQQVKDKDASARARGNPLMDFLRNTPHSNIHDLRVSTEVNEAMQMFLHRLLGTLDARELDDMETETSAVELSRLLYWLLIVGYTLRNMEVRFSMEQSYHLPVVSLEDKGLSGEF